MGVPGGGQGQNPIARDDTLFLRMKLYLHPTLNRGEVAKAIGIGKSALRQNPAIKTALENLEQNLRDRGVLPELTETAQAQRSEPKRYDPSVNQRAMESRRLSVLEQENIELKARVATLEAKLKRYGELSEVLTEFGVAPNA